MKKLLLLAALCSAMVAKAQFSAQILQTIDTAYYSIARLADTPYIAALHKDGIDIRTADKTGFGTRINGLTITALDAEARMELVGTHAYVMNYTLTAIDLTHPIFPVTGTSVPLPDRMVTYGHWGNFLYVSTGYQCYIYSLAAPMTPVLIDSVDMYANVMKCHGNHIFTVPMDGYIYEWTASTSAPYLTITDSAYIPNFSFVTAMDISGNQLMMKNGPDSLYRFRINAGGGLTKLMAEPVPMQVYNSGITARDTNIVALPLYNSLYVSSGFPAASFLDTIKVTVDGNYTINCGLVDNNIFYTNTARTYLITFNKEHTGIERTGNRINTILYPNPANETLQVTADQPGSYTAHIINMLGNMVEEHAFNGTGATIDVTPLPAGVYVVDICNAQQKVISTHKLIKQ